MGFLESLAALREGPVGFTLHEVMTGYHEFEPGLGPAGRQPMEFHVTWGPRDLAVWLRPGTDGFLRQELEGHVSIGGLCDRAPCRGTLEVRYFADQKIRYAFALEANGRPYGFVGEKVNIRPWNLPVSHTTCFGRLVEAQTGRLVSTSVTFFRMRTALQFATSFRLSLPDAATRPKG
ncbi:MAG TPA: hypothetical protein DFS52_02175 [Myxococcales bacterium]|nr:hypothetical protein [Myxococcales bacterium]